VDHLSVDRNSFTVGAYGEENPVGYRILFLKIEPLADLKNLA
jgi:hypothetical protein